MKQASSECVDVCVALQSIDDSRLNVFVKSYIERKEQEEPFPLMFVDVKSLYNKKRCR